MKSKPSKRSDNLKFATETLRVLDLRDLNAVIGGVSRPDLSWTCPQRQAE